MSIAIEVLYFAALRDASRVASESVQTSATDLAGLYAELQGRHPLPFAQQQLRVAVDGSFVDWGDALRAGSTVAFIPPVSGG